MNCKFAYFSLVLLLLMVVFLPVSVSNAEEFKEIRTPEELMGMADDPSGNYKLMSDIDMSENEWVPFSFSGTFDGNGYSILNLSVKSTGSATKDTYDGNFKVYDTYFSGMFDVLSGAEIKNLNLYNLTVDVESDSPCFIGSIAGYMEESEITDCSIEARLTLRAHDRMFGVGGVIGYGNGKVERDKADVTLVCIDTDSSTRDEQFMGGVSGAGYPDITETDVKIDGYASEHGYAHNGGLVGMYVLYPQGLTYEGIMDENYVEGKITFYEDNTDRRAYCEPYFGEIMNWTFLYGNMDNDFTRDEVKCYEIDLLPMGVKFPREDYEDQFECSHKNVTDIETKGDCDSFGYITHTCSDCGYSWKDTYTLKQHDYEWTVAEEAFPDKEGLKVGVCKKCGDTVEETFSCDNPDIYEKAVFNASDILRWTMDNLFQAK